MSYWELANEIEELSYKLDSVMAVMEVIAESDPRSLNSSALWGCAEMIKIYSEKLEALSNRAMKFHKALPQKGKK